jgi:hypothetical protein
MPGMSNAMNARAAYDDWQMKNLEENERQECRWNYIGIGIWAGVAFCIPGIPGIPGIYGILLWHSSFLAFAIRH